MKLGSIIIIMCSGIKIAVVIYRVHVYNMILVSGHNAYYVYIVVSI